MDNAVQSLVDQVAPPSTVLEPVADSLPSGAGPAPTLEDTIKNSLDQVRAEQPADVEAPAEAEDPKAEPEVKAKEEKPAEKAEKPAEEPAPKPRAKDGKFSKAEAQEGDDDHRPEGFVPMSEAEKAKIIAESNGHIIGFTKYDRPIHPEYEPPKRLLPDALERWSNTPRSVQRDITMLAKQYDALEQEYAERGQRYESLRPFDELAKSNGRDLRESLVKLNHIENMISQNPVAGLDAVLRELGSKYSLYDIAQHVVGQGPQAYQQTVQQASQQAQQSQKDAYVQQLEQQVQQLAVEQKKAQIQAEVIAPFKASHPRFDEPAIQKEIAHLIQTLPYHPDYANAWADLSTQERLEIAYERADRNVPASSSGQRKQHLNGLDPSVDRVEPDSSGTKSVKSSPGAISATEDISGLSVDELLAKNLKKVMRR